MSLVLTLEKPKQLQELEHPFLQELIRQIRIADKFQRYRDCSDEILLTQFIRSKKTKKITTKNLELDFFHKIMVNAFYDAIAVIIKRKTGYNTDTFVHLNNQEFSSAVISCGGVLVLYSLIWGYRNFNFLSLQELIGSAENSINNAVNKASHYLDF